MPYSSRHLERLILERLEQRDIPAAVDRLPRKKNGEQRYAVRIQVGVELLVPEHVASRDDDEANDLAMRILTDKAIDDIGNVMKNASGRLLDNSPSYNESA